MSRFIEHKNEISCGGSSWCTHCGKAWDTGDIDPPECSSSTPKIVNATSPTDAIPTALGNRRYQRFSTDGNALIGFLAAKLACYEPDSDLVKQAKEYLNART